MQYYYKSKDGKSFLNLKTPMTDGNYIEITEQEFAELTVPKQPTAEQLRKAELLARIGELKSNLAKTDYQAIKFCEGELTAEEYAETKAQRKAWREQINELEQQL